MFFFNRQEILQFWARWERPASIVSLIFGFIFDLVVAKRPDSLYDNLLLLSYLFIAAGCIALLNKRASPGRKVDGIAVPEAQPLATLLVLQFCFGGLASNLLVLYGHSGTISGDLLFIGLLGALLIGNEFLRNRYSQLRFNLAVYYLLLLTYFMIAVPTFLFHSIGALVFLASGILSFIAMGFFMYLLSGSVAVFRGKTGSARIKESMLIVAGIFAVFTVLYFGKLIPPVPLSLKAIGIYHALAHTQAGYEGSYESAPWWQFWSSTSDTYHMAEADEPAYCFSSIFAPTGLSAPIVHRWEWYDQSAGSWVTESRVTFPITGGGSRGYFGYSIEALHRMGQWRCDVETASGELIGRTAFTAVAGGPASLVQKTL